MRPTWRVLFRCEAGPAVAGDDLDYHWKDPAILMHDPPHPGAFIISARKAGAANVYLILYPKEPLRRALTDSPSLKRRVWTVLNNIRPLALIDEGRVYGGGLYKLEPRELANVPAAGGVELLPE